MAKVFVSHATADTAYVEALVDTVLLECGLSRPDIFVSSIPGMDIAAGSDLMAEVRKEVSEATLVIAVITRTYMTRPICVAELGAAWGVAGKLIPVLAPGLDRADLEGVLAGLKIDYLNDEATLDAVQQGIKDLTGAEPHQSASWTRAKKKWLRQVDGLSSELAEPDTASASETSRLREEVADLTAALADAEAEAEQQLAIIAELRELKDADAASEILLPRDDLKRFEALRAAANKTLAEVSSPVRAAVRTSTVGGVVRRPSRYEDATFNDEVDQAIQDGLLYDSDDEYLRLNHEMRVVREAVDAVRSLAEDLETHGYSEAFFEWFQEEFGGPPDLSMAAIWRAVFPRLI